MSQELLSAAAEQLATGVGLETAGGLMTTPIVSVTVGTSVCAAARLLLEKRISAVPVLDAEQHLVGMVREGNLPVAMTPIESADAIDGWPRSETASSWRNRLRR